MADSPFRASMLAGTSSLAFLATAIGSAVSTCSEGVCCFDAPGDDACFD